MNRRRTPLATAILLLAVVTAPALAHDEAMVLSLATRTLEEMAANPNTGVPLNLLRASEGVVLVPNMINASFIFGAKIGRGVFLVRDSMGRWGNPVFLHVTGGTFGLQARAQATELLMVFRSKETVTRLLAGKGKITLGVDAGVAAGPAGTGVGADTDLGMRAEILTYARSRGLFAGASLGGSGLTIDRRQGASYYGDFAATTYQIIEGDGVGVPLEAARLKAVVTALTDPAAVEVVVPKGADRGVVVEPIEAPPTRLRPIEEGVSPRRQIISEPIAPGSAGAARTTRPPSGVDEPVGNDLPPASRMKPVRREGEPAPAEVPRTTTIPESVVPLEGPSPR